MKILKFLLVISLSICSLSTTQTSLAAEHQACPAFPYFRPSTGPLALINCDFHHAYEARVKDMISSFGAINGRPIILNLGGTLLLKYRGKTENIDITPDTFHEIKTFAHAAVALYLTLSSSPEGKLKQAQTSKLKILQKNLQSAKAAIPSLHVPVDAAAIALQLADVTENYLNQILKNGQWTSIELAEYFKQTRPLIDEAIRLAAQLELNVLDKAVNLWLKPMSPEEKQAIGIVIATAHQARAGEISIQYFSKKFNRRVGVGALNENGMVVVEDKFDEQSALALLARHYLDREASGMIFNEPDHLQHDLLDEATKKLLKNIN